MAIVDIAQTPSSSAIVCDVCIVGSGPAGATIARELDGSGLDVVLLESGGRARQPSADELNEIESTGYPRVMDQWRVRNRMLGGSSMTWTGRCAPFDQDDFTERDWVPHSGWPIERAELAHYYIRAASHLGLQEGFEFSDETFWKIVGLPNQTPAFDDKLLVPFFWQFSQDAENKFDYMRFGKTLAAADGGNAKIILNATVTHIDTDDAASRVTSLEVRAPDMSMRTVKARKVILCAGGIENARLLLTSNRVEANGLGNRHNLVGRFLMDHPRGRVGRFAPGAPTDAALKWFGIYSRAKHRRRHAYRHGLRLSPDFQKRHGLLQSAVWLNEAAAEDDPWNSVKHLLRGRGSMHDLVNIASNMPLIVKGTYQYQFRSRGLARKLSALELECIVEQPPDSESCVTLSSRTDRYGIPLSRINWRVGRQEQETVRTTASLVESEFRRLGMAPPVLEPWVVDGADFPPDFTDIAHPTGTTRMSSDARTGVTDANCQIHGVEGLYVCGSSVFPTSSHINPTHTIVAMAVRLADHLKTRPA